MDHYIDIRLRPDPEFPAGQLMSALHAKLHRGLCDLGGSQIGISFPQYGKRSLGEHLRLHGSAAALQTLMNMDWLQGMRDLVSCSEMAAAPADSRYRCFSRVQFDSNPERLRRRLIKRHGISEAEALERIPDSAGQFTALPFVHVRSNHNGQRFRLFIRPSDLLARPQEGTFSKYGLSSQATVPWF